ncbi:hypothetical protein AGMMS49975_01780 [Clostridia bacterium]|nr:hypothetical protein AGMMS49975_01780 [Clostridia bacterium]
MAVTGFRKWYLSILVLGAEFLYYEIEWDDEDNVADLSNYNTDLEKYASLDAQIKAAEKEKDAIKQKIQMAMGKAEIGESESYKVTWKTSLTKLWGLHISFRSKIKELPKSNSYSDTKV